MPVPDSPGSRWFSLFKLYEQSGTSPARSRIAALLEQAGIRLNGTSPWDIQVHDNRVFRRLMMDGALGLGEAYVDGWWDVGQLDEMILRLRRAHLDQSSFSWHGLMLHWRSVFFNLQSPWRAARVAAVHYDLGNNLFEAMLGPLMQYSCAYWADAQTLEEAQRNKLSLVCRKLGLRSGMKVLELGGGFGGFARYAAENFGCEVVRYNISARQVEYARRYCFGLPVRIEQRDYREVSRETGKFDRIVSIGMFEHIGYKNHEVFFATAHKALADGGLFLLHTIGANQSFLHTDPWVDRYIFPNGVLPSIVQIGKALEGSWTKHDRHNFGPA